MNRHLTQTAPVFLALLALIWVLIMQASSVAGAPADDIIITGAARSRDLPSTDSAGLRNDIANVLPRLVVQFSEAMREFTLSAAPTQLQALLTAVTDRVVIQFAEAARAMPLAYPGGKLNDATPPKVATPQSGLSQGGTTATIRWTTDEFAKSVFQYGTQPNSYTQTVTDPLYVREHSVTLDNLTPDASYYFVISSTDRDGNTATTSEASFKTTSQYFIYLPNVRR